MRKRSLNLKTSFFLSLHAQCRYYLRDSRLQPCKPSWPTESSRAPASGCNYHIILHPQHKIESDFLIGSFLKRLMPAARPGNWQKRPPGAPEVPPHMRAAAAASPSTARTPPETGPAGTPGTQTAHQGGSRGFPLHACASVYTHIVHRDNNWGFKPR